MPSCRPKADQGKLQDAVGGLKDTRSARPAPPEENLAGRVPDSHQITSSAPAEASGRDAGQR